jgi:hypothetical protein
MEMRAQTMADVTPIFVAPTPNLFHHNNVGVTYVRTSNLRMEPIDLYHYIMWQCPILWLQLLKFHLQ